jgi:hypothetical protein
MLYIKVPQYTFSKVQSHYDKNTESESGSGWSCEGLENFNAIAEMGKNDWELCGATFSSKLYKVFKNTKKSKAKTNCRIDPKKQRPLIYYDIDNDDDSEQEDTMNMFPLYAFKLVTACVNVLLLSADTAISDLTNG